jgi:hypothetical protein
MIPTPAKEAEEEAEAMAAEAAEAAKVQKDRDDAFVAYCRIKCRWQEAMTSQTCSMAKW